MVSGLWGLITNSATAQKNDTLNYILQPGIEVRAKAPVYTTEAEYKITPGRMIHVEFGKPIAKVVTISKGEVEIYRNHLFVHPLKNEEYPVSYHILFSDGSSFVLRLKKGGRNERDYFRVLTPEVSGESIPERGPVLPPPVSSVPSEDIRDMMIAMYNDYPQMGAFKRIKLEKEIPYRLPGSLKKRGAVASVSRVFMSPSLWGYVIRLQLSDKAKVDSLTIHERELFIPGIRGIALTGRWISKDRPTWVLIASGRPLVNIQEGEK